jgi:hypothetical protein
MLVNLSKADDKGKDDLSDLVAIILYRFCYNRVIALNEKVLGLKRLVDDAPPHSLKDSNVSSKMKITKEKRVRVTLPSLQHFEGKRGVLEFSNGD